MEREYCVYMHRFPNGKVYIGITNQDPEKRWNGGRGYKANHGLFSEILKYGWVNIEHIQALLASEMSKKMWANPGYREKMHEKMSGPDSPHAKPVDQFTKDGAFVKRYPSCKIAAEETGTNRSGVTSCAKGRQETAGGYVWRYAE